MASASPLLRQDSPSMVRFFLADFVEQAATNQGISLDGPSRPFNGRAAHDPPLLRPHGPPNHILLFPGSFNPPHTGHLALLRHILFAQGPGVSPIGAVVVLTDDVKLAAKNHRDERPFLLPKAKRAALWRQANVPRDRVWVFDGSEDEWKRLKGELDTILARNGISLPFHLLVGPDWISVRSVTDPRSWGCLEAVTSDISRRVDFRCPHSLRQLPRCSAWVPSALPDTVPSEAAVDGFCGEHVGQGPPTNRQPRRHLAERGIHAAIDAPRRTTWVCQTLRKPLRRYRFVPSQTADPPPRPAPSSTEIRRIVATCDEELLEAELEKTALGAALLKAYAVQHGPYSSPVAREKSPDHVTKKTLADRAVQW
ncbi:hypothetical protein DCS_05514 [Drechmeria coniospora]|uniref:Cytidyltransferase-like domain-containing protein n=1 Tax=Drechmeria coniospora TaxID=98403 RepID=A0A151GN46_DRECN|nr:hypothetical protein DCS_05514 [Drechmeria coniospora]KYK58498.1 hypothetical protein DCS_05514 [Drechmeria coniospora]